MNNLIQTVGAYAGLLALVAIVILSLLVFSLARDLRRLREWAGGAPERDAEVREISEIVADERSRELQVLAEREQRRNVRAGYADASFWERLGRPGRIMAIVAAILVLGAAAAWAGTSLIGGGDDGGKVTRSAKQGKKNRNASGDAGPKSPSPDQIKVGVLNGTGGTEAGLAAEYANVLEDKGYSLGAVTDAPETFTESIVMYLKGNEAEAKEVGNAIGISQTGLMTSDVAALTPGAMATAVIGTDHGPLPSGG